MKNLLMCVVVGVLTAGCGTIMDTGNLGQAEGSNGPHIYGGLRGDMQMVSESTSAVSTTLLVIDMIPSAIYDTALLPASITKAIAK